MAGLRSSHARIDRRTVLKGLGAGLAASVVPSPAIVQAQAQFRANPFTLGVASGEPASDGFVIWTRLAPDPLGFRGGMAMGPAEVSYEIAADPAMREVVRKGEATARIEVAHSVHVEVEGLEPARDYFYRFRARDAESPIGRARTLPLPGAEVGQLRFAAAGCQRWENGYYTAWRRIAEEAFDFVCHYGDYIYERPYEAVDRDSRPLPRTMPRDFPTCVTLVDYRRRYTLYKGDPDLQAAHASCPFLPSFDDHEVIDNWAGENDPKNSPTEAFLFRRAAAFQAWYEHMPVRRRMAPRGPDLMAYRSLRFGKLADIAVLDTRQYRSKQPCGDGFKADCRQADEPQRTLLGETQERWLADTLRAATGTWQVLAQQVLFSRLDFSSFHWSPSHEPGTHNLDVWDGATAARQRLLTALRETRAANPIVLTGDAHMGMAFEVRNDWDDAKSCVAAEFLAPSISSNGDGERIVRNSDAILAKNPQLRFLGNERGYVRHTVTPERWQADYRILERVSSPGAPAITRKSFVVEAGRAGLVDA